MRRIVIKARPRNKVRSGRDKWWRDEWGTPDSVFKPLNALFKFNLDPCGSEFSHKCDIWISKEQNGLKAHWRVGPEKTRAFVNPPYSNIMPWVQKALHEADEYGTLSVLLLPVRTDNDWWPLLWKRHIDADMQLDLGTKVDFDWLRKRINFIRPPGSPTNDDSPKFPSVIAIIQG